VTVLGIVLDSLGGCSRDYDIGGWIAQGLGYPPMFLTLAAIALASIALWLMFRGMLTDAER
jgi:hypothetical protein